MAEHRATAKRLDQTTISMEIPGAPPTWLQLADIRGVTPPGFDTELEDVTHLSTPKGTREYLGGRSAPQSVSATIGYAPGSPTIVALMEARGETRKFRIDYPNGIRHSFEAIVQTWSPGESTGGTPTGTLTLQISGEVDEGEVDEEEEEEIL